MAAATYDFEFNRRLRDGWTRWLTQEGHGDTNADGTARKHCCGCWNVWIDPSDLFTLRVQCGECGEERAVRIPGIAK